MYCKKYLLLCAVSIYDFERLFWNVILKGRANMIVDSDYLIPQSVANRDFRKVCRIADRNSYAMILCHSEPKYILVTCEELGEAMDKLGFVLRVKDTS